MNKFKNTLTNKLVIAVPMTSHEYYAKAHQISNIGSLLGGDKGWWINEDDNFSWMSDENFQQTYIKFVEEDVVKDVVKKSNVVGFLSKSLKEKEFCESEVLTVDQVIDDTRTLKLTEVLIIGYNKSSTLVTRSTNMTRGQALFICEKAKIHILGD